MIFNVPLAVSAGWATIIYLGYNISVAKLKANKILSIDLETSFIGLVVDFLLLEPLAYIFKLWVWTENDFWFGAPLFNFIGWFLVITTFVVSYNLALRKSENYITKIKFLLFYLILGLIITQIFTNLYRYFFGWF